MNLDLRAAVLWFAVFWVIFFIALTLGATGSFFLPPRTFGELLTDVFTLAGVVFMLAVLRVVIGVLRRPPEP